MEIYQGRSVSGGIAAGRIRVFNRAARQIGRMHVEDVDAELLRYREAKKKGIAQLRRLCGKAREEIGETYAAIFEIHQMLMEDQDYNTCVEETVREKKVDAAYAVAAARDRFAETFAAMQDEYMRGRAADIVDISERLLSILSGDGSRVPAQPEEPAIIVLDNITPSEVVQAEKGNLLAMVTLHGSPNSHAAILARTMGIPIVTAVDMPLDDTVDEKYGIVDGANGRIYVDPDDETLRMFDRRQQEEIEERELLNSLKDKETVTLDGRRVMLRANIGNVRDIGAVMEDHADGAGLLRSEFIYFEKDHLPTEEEQFEVYRQAVTAMQGKRITIRTMDIGADKQCAGLEMEPEENPALGYRAIRICLTQPEIFRVQLRALLRAGAYGDLAIMYPMITSVWEVRRIKEIVATLKAELDAEGIPHGEPEQGIMIETPAAALISDALAAEVDFLSIGTNDLTQYALALDRQNTKLDAFYDPHHPAILRMIEMVVENAHRAGIRAGICGELGADPGLTEKFLRMGVDEFSVSPGSILPIRRRIRETDLGRNAK